MKKLILLALLLSFAPACATNPPPTAVASVANVGGQIEATAHTILTTAQSLNQNQIQNPVSHALLVPTAAVDQIAIAVFKVGHLGIDLGAALNTYNAAKLAKQDLTEPAFVVQQLLNLVTAAMLDVGKAIPPGTVQQIDTLVTAVMTLVAQFKTGVGL